MEEGVVFETLNMASKMSLPILFICENNLYSTHTPLNERTLEKKPSNRVKSFNIDTDYFEGNDPDKLFNLMLKITKKIRKQKKPHFIEIKTYRFNGHVGPEGDDHFNYRDKKEINEWIKKDPLNNYVKKLSKNNKKFFKIKEKIDKQNIAKIKGHLILQKKINFQRNIKMIILEILLRVLKNFMKIRYLLEQFKNLISLNHINKNEKKNTDIFTIN